ncbi:hypothetical protein FRACYDRAFT_249519 [Fragilariopsis cylindrus CCMP1102]|uniref:Uncharacterized protein n=1 Tax=Fragilariopsis cylindrus CCMP1102 TaxID=635003 RepID=A0A1E7ES01_9STRA|nr:hypothetical protein FRACYDRAFT_249519 [Fragilariopsis cylindrus CCMP1102]|eukprot:OEU08626.1 hypothetical protein FRACYDRAFT_249519 [Fragilariopsis cylindrus CCMP1102]
MCRIRNILKDAVIGLYKNPLLKIFWFVVLCMYVDTFPKFVSDNNFNGSEYDNDHDNDEQQQHVWYCTRSFVLGIYDFGYNFLRSIISFFVNVSVSVNGDDHSSTSLSHYEYPWREAELELESLASKVTTITTTTWNHQILIKVILMIPQMSYLAYCVGYIFGDLLILFLYIISCHIVYFYLYGNLREMKNKQQQQHHPCTTPPMMASMPSMIQQAISTNQQTLLLGVEVPVNLRLVISNTISHVNDKAFDSFLFWFLIVVTTTATSSSSTPSSSTTPTADIEDIIISKLKGISIIGVLDFGRNWLFSNGINDNDSDNENYEGDKMSYITMIGAIFTFLVFFCFTWGLFVSSEEVEEEIRHQKEEKKKKIETTRTTRKVISDTNSNNYKKQIIGYGGGRRQFYSKKKKTIFTPTSSKAASASTTKPMRIAGSLTSRASCIDHNNNNSINKIQDNTHRDTASATYSKSTADVNINEKKNMNARTMVVVEDSQKNHGKVDSVTKCNEREHEDRQDNNATTATITFKEILSSLSTTTQSDPLEAAFASLLPMSSRQSGHAFSSDSKESLSYDATPMSMSPSKLSSSSCTKGNRLLSCAATAVTKVSCSNKAMPMSPKSWPTLSNIETTSFPRTDADAADEHDDNAVLPQLKPNQYPRSILSRYYSKKHRNIKTKLEYFVTWDNGIKISGMPSFTSSFVCPITNEIFFAGPFSARGMQIAVKKKKMSEVVAPDEDGIYWYPCKKLAEHAAAARALDCLLMRDGGKDFNSDDNFCALEPYMPADKQTYPGDNGIPDQILEQIVILARNSTRSSNEDVVVAKEEGEEKCDLAEAVATIAIIVVPEAIAVEAESLLEKEEKDRSALSLSLKQEDNDIVEQEDFEKASDAVGTTTCVTIRKERNYYYEITVQQSGGDIPDLLLPSSSSLPSSPSPASSSSSPSSWKRNFIEDEDTISTTTSSNISSEGTEESGRSKDSCQFIVEMMESETVSQQQTKEHPSLPRRKRLPPPGFLRMKLLKEEKEERARQQQAHEPAVVAPPPGFEQKLMIHQTASENGSLVHHHEQPIGPPPGFYPVSLHDHDK